MSRHAGIDAQTAAPILSEITGSEFGPLGPLAGGETGAHEFLVAHIYHRIDPKIL